MRMKSWAFAAALTAAAVLPGLATAQKPAEPTLEIRLRSVNDLLDKAEYVGGLADKDEPVKQLRGLVQSLSTDGKGIEGIDPKRPFGAYALLLADDIKASPIVLMIPIADQERFLAALKDRLAVVPEKAEGGTLKANVPIINELYLRFASDYLYISQAAKNLDAKSIISPKTFFANDDGAVVSVTAHFDRIPAELKTLVIGQFEHQVQEGLKKNAAGKAAPQKRLEALVADTVVGSTKMLFDDGKDLSLKVFVDPKSDELSAEVTLTARDGSALSKTIAGLSGKTSLPAGIVASKNTVVRGGGKLELSADQKKQLGPIIDDLVADAIQKSGDREAARKVLEPLAATAKSGELDAAFALVGPNEKGKHAVLVAAMVKDAKELEKVAKEFAPAIPADAAEVTFDVEKVGSFALHKVVINHADAEFERLFGTKNVWLAVSDDCIALSIESDGALLKAGLKAKLAPASVFAVEAALAKAVPLFEKNLKPDEVKALVKDAFGGMSPVGKDTLGLTVEGGKQLTARVKMKGKAFRLATMLDEFKLK
jgi:hypothetical protein